MHAYGQFRNRVTGEVASATWGLSPFTVTLPDGRELVVKEDDFFFEDESRVIHALEFLAEWEPVDQIARKLFAVACKGRHP